MNDNKFRTSDFPSAIYLSYEGFVLEDIEGDEQRKEFVFARKQGIKIEDVLQKFQRKQTLVEPNRYFDEVKNVKRRLPRY